LHLAYASDCEFAGTLGEMTFREIVELHPLPGSDLRNALLRCAEECLDCGASCTACADASLSESDVVELTGVIRVCLDCADVCEATARIATRQNDGDAFARHRRERSRYESRRRRAAAPTASRPRVMFGFMQPQYWPCGECGASVPVSEEDTHECDRQRWLDYQMFQHRGV
jgi:hypothetical protein